MAWVAGHEVREVRGIALDSAKERDCRSSPGSTGQTRTPRPGGGRRAARQRRSPPRSNAYTPRRGSSPAPGAPVPRVESRRGRCAEPVPAPLPGQERVVGAASRSTHQMPGAVLDRPYVRQANAIPPTSDADARRASEARGMRGFRRRRSPSYEEVSSDNRPEHGPSAPETTPNGPTGGKFTPWLDLGLEAVRIEPRLGARRSWCRGSQSCQAT